MSRPSRFALALLLIAAAAGTRAQDEASERDRIEVTGARLGYELIAAIAEDTREVAAARALDCQITLDGLNSRIAWERVSAGELLLYIPTR